MEINGTNSGAAIFALKKALEIPKDEIGRALDEELGEPFKRNSPGALILRVLLWDKATDWCTGGKLSNYPPLEWHHIVPKKILQNMLVDEKVFNNIANMTLLSETANKEFKDKPPWIYGPDRIKDPARLESHLIPKSHAATFISGRTINRTDELAKFLSERLNLIRKVAHQLLLP